MSPTRIRKTYKALARAAEEERLEDALEKDG
jgi:hypothetical protein